MNGSNYRLKMCGVVEEILSPQNQVKRSRQRRPPSEARTRVLGKLLFLDRACMTKNAVLYKRVGPSSKRQRETQRGTRDHSRATWKEGMPVRLLDPAEKPSPLVWWFYLVGNDLTKDLFFKRHAFDWKKLHPENEPCVWPELQRYKLIENRSVI